MAQESSAISLTSEKEKQLELLQLYLRTDVQHDRPEYISWCTLEDSTRYEVVACLEKIAHECSKLQIDKAPTPTPVAYCDHPKEHLPVQIGHPPSAHIKLFSKEPTEEYLKIVRIDYAKGLFNYILSFHNALWQHPVLIALQDSSEYFVSLIIWNHSSRLTQAQVFKLCRNSHEHLFDYLRCFFKKSPGEVIDELGREENGRKKYSYFAPAMKHLIMKMVFYTLKPPKFKNDWHKLYYYLDFLDDIGMHLFFAYRATSKQWNDLIFLRSEVIKELIEERLPTDRVPDNETIDDALARATHIIESSDIEFTIDVDEKDLIAFKKLTQFDGDDARARAMVMLLTDLGRLRKHDLIGELQSIDPRLATFVVWKHHKNLAEVEKLQLAVNNSDAQHCIVYNHFSELTTEAWDPWEENTDTDLLGCFLCLSHGELSQEADYQLSHFGDLQVFICQTLLVEYQRWQTTNKLSAKDSMAMNELFMKWIRNCFDRNYALCADFVILCETEAQWNCCPEAIRKEIVFQLACFVDMHSAYQQRPAIQGTFQEAQRVFKRACASAGQGKKNQMVGCSTLWTNYLLQHDLRHSKTQGKLSPGLVETMSGQSLAYWLMSTIQDACAKSSDARFIFQSFCYSSKGFAKLFAYVLKYINMLRIVRSSDMAARIISLATRDKSSIESEAHFSLTELLRLIAADKGYRYFITELTKTQRENLGPMLQVGMLLAFVNTTNDNDPSKQQVLVEINEVCEQQHNKREFFNSCFNLAKQIISKKGPFAQSHEIHLSRVEPNDFPSVFVESKKYADTLGPYLKLFSLSMIFKGLDQGRDKHFTQSLMAYSCGEEILRRIIAEKKGNSHYENKERERDWSRLQAMLSRDEKNNRFILNVSEPGKHYTWAICYVECGFDNNGNCMTGYTHPMIVDFLQRTFIQYQDKFFNEQAPEKLGQLFIFIGKENLAGVFGKIKRNNLIAASTALQLFMQSTRNAELFLTNETFSRYLDMAFFIRNFDLAGSEDESLVAAYFSRLDKFIKETGGPGAHLQLLNQYQEDRSINKSHLDIFTIWIMACKPDDVSEPFPQAYGASGYIDAGILSLEKGLRHQRLMEARQSTPLSEGASSTTSKAATSSEVILDNEDNINSFNALYEHVVTATYKNATVAKWLDSNITALPKLIIAIQNQPRNYDRWQLVKNYDFSSFSSNKETRQLINNLKTQCADFRNFIFFWDEFKNSCLVTMFASPSGTEAVLREDLLSYQAALCPGTAQSNDEERCRIISFEGL